MSLRRLPWQESLFGDGVAVIEWPDRLGRLLPAERWDIKFSISGEENRKMLLCGHGRKNRARMAKWVETFKKAQIEALCGG